MGSGSALPLSGSSIHCWLHSSTSHRSLLSFSIPQDCCLRGSDDPFPLTIVEEIENLARALLADSLAIRGDEDGCGHTLVDIYTERSGDVQVAIEFPYIDFE